jgi:2-keto-4-pentenoate hydratase/2-oxohepta-3-ene-1,7-dioic acid hydratase in catechol pathway
MKLLRYGPAGQEKPGLLDADGLIRDLSAHVSDIDAASLAPEALDRLRALSPADLPVIAGTPRLGPPVAKPGNILCIGLNYRDHVAESGMAVPAEPVVFSKHTGALNGPNDAVVLPRGSNKADWEVELAVVIGRRTQGVREAAALDYVAGYTVCNDVSERTFQLERGGQWIKGKSAETFCPLGPVLITADEIPDPQALRLWLSVNDQPMQDGTTADMVFPVAHLISYLSGFMTLLPGDVIATGTPKGTGMGRGVFLKRGDIMRLGIDGIGVLEQRVE